jgi:hypothetical protein
VPLPTKMERPVTPIQYALETDIEDIALSPDISPPPFLRLRSLERVLRMML